ncbi:hypothetical protein PENTCL1PPCAC_12972, partial [Pristionchus entomophagus]
CQPGRKPRSTVTAAKEFECPECEYHSISPHAWRAHLRIKHSTTPKLAGLALRCECGHETYSATTTHDCDIAIYSVIRKRDGPI